MDVQRLVFAAVRGDLDDALPMDGVGVDVLPQRSPRSVAEHDIRLDELVCRVRERLWHTAGQYDCGARILPTAPPQQLSQLAIALAGDGAGIDHDNVARVTVRSSAFLGVVAGGLHHLAHRLRLVLIDLTAECVKNSLHGSPRSFVSIQIIPQFIQKSNRLSEISGCVFDRILVYCI